MIIIAIPSNIAAIMRLTARCIAMMRNQGIDQWDNHYPNEQTFLQDIADDSLYLYWQRDQSAALTSSDQLVGSIVINQTQAPEYQQVAWQFHSSAIGVIHRLMVDPAYQGRGIAQQLIDFAATIARQRGYQVLRLDAFLSNPRAIKFYHQLGYRFAGEITLRKGQFACFEKQL